MLLRTATLATLVSAVFAAPDAPQQIHLAYGTPSYSSITVSWQTLNFTSTSQVKYGLQSNSLTNTAVGLPPTTYLYTYDHHVTITGLEPKTLYYYSCGDASAGFSDVYNFTTAPLPGQEFPLNIALFADMGNYNSAGT
jgi:acid phosphatase type 7